MRNILVAAGATALLSLGVAQPSFAYTIDGAVNGLNQYASASFVSGTFSDAYSFSLSGLSDVNASFTGNPGTAFSLSDFAIYSTSTDAKETTTFNSSLIFNNFQAGTDTVQLGAGNYFIGVTGASGSAEGTFTGTLAVSAVPLPPSLILFGLSLVGLGTIAVVRRRRGPAAATPGIA